MSVTTIGDWLIAIIAAGGGGALIAFGIMRAFGERWLDSKFAGRLQDMRHEHERQMELQKLQTSQSLDRFTRLTEREFEATAEAWSLVTDVNVRTLSALPGYRQFEDFSKLSDDLAKLVAQQNDFAEWEVQELIAKPKNERLGYFIERNALHEINKAKRSIGKANGHLTRAALFIDRRIHSELDAFLDLAWKALIAWEIVREIRQSGGGPGAFDGIKRDDEEFRKNASERIKRLEALVRGRFWPEDVDVDSETAASELL